MASADRASLTGGCHCGTVRYEVTASVPLQLLDCNCSICRKAGYLHLIVPKQDFKLLSGEASLTTYTFNTGTARHPFCSQCGIKSFYVPRSHPDGISVNARCLDTVDLGAASITTFDGANWEQNVDKIR